MPLDPPIFVQQIFKANTKHNFCKVKLYNVQQDSLCLHSKLVIGSVYVLRNLTPLAVTANTFT